MSKALLKKSLTEAPIVKKGEYSYVIHPITDGIPEISPALLDEVTNELFSLIKSKQPFDKIVTMEAMGIPLASVLSLKMNIPFTIIRKRSYELTEEKIVQQVTGYSTSTLSINGLSSDDNVIIVDDVLSTGGTLRAVLHTLKDMGVKVKAVFVAIDKGTNAEKITKETNIPVHALVRIAVEDGHLVFLDE